MPKHLLWAPFSKVEEQDDGTLKVFGVASSESRDSDGEVIKADAVRAALPDYLEFGAVREMHQPIAAGTALEAEVDRDGITSFAAHIVDASSVKKVQTGVLKGFSLGGKVTKRNKLDKSIIEGINLTEISLVDRPANPDSVITLAKADKSGMLKVLDSTDDDAEIPPTKPKTPMRKGKRDSAPATEPLAKGMYDVSRLADLLQSLHWCYTNSKLEAEMEGDGSSVPAQLRSSCIALARTLRDMLSEETAEMLGLSSIDDEDLLNSAAKAIATGDLVKVGRTFSKSTAAAIGELHKMCKDMDASFGKLGYDSTTDNEDDDMADNANKGAASDDLAKSVTALADRLEKAEGSITKMGGELTETKDELAKANLTLATTTAERDTAVKERDELLAESAKMLEFVKAKGSIRSVPKEADALGKGGASKDDEEVEDFASAFKKSVQGGPIAVRG